MKIKFLLLLLCSVSLFAECDQDKIPVVLVIGGGPAGLATAVQAKEQGFSVIVIEKREKYSRWQLLGLWDETIERLSRWKVSIPEMQVIDIAEDLEEGRQIGLVPINSLEEGLQKHSEALGVQRIEGSFVELKANQEVVIQTKKETLVIPYDLLVGADGTHSLVRESLGIDKNNFSSARGAIVLIPPDSLGVAGLSPIIKSGHEFMRIFNFYSWMEVIGIQSPLTCSKSQIREFFKNQRMIKELRALDKGYAWVLEDIPILLDQAQRFSDRDRSAILVGDAAASASFIRGRGANMSLKSAELAGMLFQEWQLKKNDAFERFNQSMQEITDKLIQENLCLFDCE